MDLRLSKYFFALLLGFIPAPVAAVDGYMVVINCIDQEVTVPFAAGNDVIINPMTAKEIHIQQGAAHIHWVTFRTPDAEVTFPFLTTDAKPSVFAGVIVFKVALETLIFDLNHPNPPGLNQDNLNVLAQRLQDKLCVIKHLFTSGALPVHASKADTEQAVEVFLAAGNPVPAPY